MMTSGDHLLKNVNLSDCLFPNRLHLIPWFLADRTIGRAYGTVCRLSSVCRRL